MESEKRANRDAALVITGASGGIGRAIALNAAKLGYSLFLQANTRFDELNRYAVELKEYGTDVHTFRADLSVEREQDRLTDDILAELSETCLLAGWFNAAGTDLMALSQRGATFDERLRTVMAVDVTAAVRMSRRIGFALCKLPPGTVRPLILFFGWDGANRGRRGENSLLYATAKGAVMSAAKALANDFAPHIRVCSISPGWIKTTWGSNASESADQSARNESLSQRWGTPNEVASCALYLLSSEADFINGENIVLNGGFDGGGPQR